MTLPDEIILCPWAWSNDCGGRGKKKQSLFSGIFLNYFSETGDESHPVLSFGIDRRLL